jgi:DNA-binding NarL/FixJ family response regulator
VFLRPAPPILIADGDRADRKLVVDLLRRIGYEPDEARTGPEALDLAKSLQPGLVLFEVNLPEISGYEVCRALRDAFDGDMAIIFLSGERTTSADRVAGLLVGADDYVVKPFDPDELLARVRSALRRHPASPRRGKDGPSVGRSLTTREREVLRLLASGLSQPEIASELFISPKTVGGHIQRVLTKLDVHSRAQAVALTHELGLDDVEGHALTLTLRAR